uniref:YitH acetyltransferase (GNAT) domain-containing protein n=1 Tax=Setaria digitata TaxID=48799 RepID=A0A915PIK5_9BILA
MGWNTILNRTLSNDVELLNQLNNIPESKSAFVRNSDGTLSGYISMISCSANQAYCMSVRIDQSIGGKFISIEPTDDSDTFQITDVQDEAEDMSLQPIFIQVFHNPNGRLALQHLVDQAAERILGRINLDMKKNVTVDLTDSDDLNVWRDKAGFVIRDKMKLCELTVNKNEFQKTLETAENIKISEFDGSQMEKIVRFDKAVSSGDRSTFLKYLFKDANVLTAESEEISAVAGYGVFCEDRILAVYAESKQIAHAIMQEILRKINYDEVTLCTMQNHWSVESKPIIHCRQITRLHTRALPTGIMWDRIFVLNLGMNLI